MEFGGELEFAMDEAIFWWVCGNDWNCFVADYWEDHPIPAPEYDWLYRCMGIPEEDLEEDIELRRECEEMKRRYSDRPTSKKKANFR